MRIAGPAPPTAATPIDDEEEQQQHGRQVKVVAERHEGGGEDRRDQHRHRPPQPTAAGSDRGASPRSGKGKSVLALGGLRADDVHVDRARVPDDSVDDGPRRELGPTRAPRRTHHELGRTLGPRDVEKRLGDIGSCGLDVATAELGQEGAVLGQQLVRWPLSAIFGSDVDADRARPSRGSRRGRRGAPGGRLRARQ